jgi:hypothetical protein
MDELSYTSYESSYASLAKTNWPLRLGSLESD